MNQLASNINFSQNLDFLSPCRMDTLLFWVYVVLIYIFKMNYIFFLSSNVAQDLAKIHLLPWLFKRLKSLFEKSICPSDMYLDFVTDPSFFIFIVKTFSENFYIKCSTHNNIFSTNTKSHFNSVSIRSYRHFCFHCQLYLNRL